MHKAKVWENAQISVVFKQMEMSDIDEVAKLEEKTFSLPWSKTAFIDVLDREEYLFIVALFENKVIGYCGFNNICGEGDITNVAVESDFRGKGIGKAMLESALKWEEEEGIFDFTLEVRVSNKNAICLYEKVGFVSEAVRKNFYERPVEDALIMWKRQANNETIATKK